ncbi:unnamed protein product [Eruca vesicaria subsp. sativa]|uniref:Uncharacterized protein n=1 Tax=Eruca vesicaria subsp. sativa TaxID=29727 RepID=A0ABC8JVF2_ERUVS|nr:unnamed protein product [Eruca vesicaria subsp. sativa]
MANIMFLYQPVGTGFSYKRTSITEKISDTVEIVRVHEFLQKVWLNKHPEFYSNPFYVAGDSYSGKIIPGLVQKISKVMFYYYMNKRIDEHFNMNRYLKAISRDMAYSTQTTSPQRHI